MKFQVFAIALLGLASLCLGAPAGAGAALIDAEVESFPVSLVGSQTTEPEFSFEGGWTGKCKKASFAGSLSAASSSYSLTATYSECTAFGFAATVTTTGCKFVFQIGEANESGAFPSTTDVSCEAGKAITIVTATCEVQISGQTGLSGVELSNNGASPNEVSAKLAIAKSLSYNKTKDGLGCPLSGTGTKTDGGIGGSSLVFGEQGAVKKALHLGRVVLCQTQGTKNVCPANGEYKKATSILGQAAENTAKLALQLDDGTVKVDFVVTCKGASIWVKTTDDIGGAFGLPASLESLSFSGCKEGSGSECTATELVAPTKAVLRAGPTAGNGTVKVSFKIRVICGEPPFFNCDYEATLLPGFTGDKNPVIEATALELPLKARVGQVNCGTEKKAKWTGAYKSSVAAWLTS
jgi:hypothetical protein